MTHSEGQSLALEQVNRIANQANSPLKLLSVRSPSDDSAWLPIDISLDCSPYKRVEGGLPLGLRERLRVYIPPDFPFEIPQIFASHSRFAYSGHVQWRRYLCLYQASNTEWNPSDGMYGFFDRLDYWLKQGARGELDAIGMPIHPPVTYLPDGPVRNVIIHPDAPVFNNTFWLGLAKLEIHSEVRVDATSWHEIGEPIGDEKIGAAILLSEPLPYEFPKKAVDLFNELTQRNVSRELFLIVVKIAAIYGQENDPLYVFIGTPMRGTAGDEERFQHLTAWYIEPNIVNRLRTAMRVRGLIRQISSEETLAEVERLAKDLESALLDWLSDTNVAWCRVMENRPEIITRRDYNTSMAWFKDKTVALWGCGALGSHVARMLVRAGVNRILLYDRSHVTPGLLVRQEFSDRDVGMPKGEALASHLSAINPNVNVEHYSRNLLKNTEDVLIEISEADLLIDTTASSAVYKKLELVCRHIDRKLPVAAMMISKQADIGIVTLANKRYSGSTYDVLRKTQIDISRRPYAKSFEEAFWPSTPPEYFQPEPGCSDPTFIASSADVAHASACMMNLMATAMQTLPEDQARTDFIITRGYNDSPRSYLQLYYLPDNVSQIVGNSYEIRMAPAALRSITAWIKTKQRTDNSEDETGGLLFGQRDDACGVIWISDASGPPPDSVSSPEGFVCGVEGVDDLNKEKSERTNGVVEYLGMWHTHPEGRANPSAIDIAGMANLLLSPLSTTPLQLMLIVGLRSKLPELGYYLFNKEDIRLHQGRKQELIEIKYKGSIKLLAENETNERDIGLALSGGGSRAIAFHLGTLRALHDLGLLDQVDIISGVSGGAVLTGSYGYTDGDFQAFEELVTCILKQGLAKHIVRHTLGYQRLFASFATLITSGSLATLSTATRHTLGRLLDILGRRGKNRPDWIDHIHAPLARWSSRTDALADVLRDQLFGNLLITDERRNDVNIVINACELRTGSAFRFGSKESGSWRFGKIVDSNISVADAVAMSAAYPLLLPAKDVTYKFEKRNGDRNRERVIITDGGLYDNLGVSCMEPGRSADFGYNTYQPTRIICSSAGPGIFSDHVKPFWWPSRMTRSFESVFRKAGDSTFEKLHRYNEIGALQGFILAYLGQQDDRLPWKPPDLVSRDITYNYPTDFFSMTDDDIRNLSLRGKQLTRLLIEYYW